MYIIAGIDPGKTSAIACVDLKGNMVFRSHRMFAGMDWFIATLSQVGTPVIIASDKPNASMIVRKINAAFNSRLYCPARELRIDEKRIEARSLGIKDPHERDAYVAAISAYRTYSNKLKQAEHIAAGKGLDNIDEIKARVVARHSISEAIGNIKANRR